MYWWNTHALAEALKTKRLSQRQKMIYLAVMMLGVSLVVEVTAWLGPGSGVTPAMGVIRGAVLSGITLWGVLACYQANRRGDDSEFIDRFVCLSLPLTIRVLIVFSLLAFALIIPVYLMMCLMMGDRCESVATLLSDLLILVAEVVFYRRLRWHLLRVSGASPFLTPSD
jgi:hypothetical protein